MAAKRTLDVSAIYAKFDAAKERGLKYPKITLRAPGSNENLQFAVSGDKSKNPDRITMTDGGRYGQNRFYGAFDREGIFHGNADRIPDPLKMTIRAFAADPAKVLVAHGHAHGNCAICTKPLTDDKSLFAGVGPVCAKRFDIPYGATE